MKLTVLEGVSSWRAIAEAWNELLAASLHNAPFLRHEFLTAWWKTLGGGEWPDGDLWVVEGRDDSGRLAAAAPLFRTTARPGTLLLIGSHEIADYLDLLVGETAAAEFAAALLDLLSEQLPEVAVVDLWNIVDDSPSLAAWQTAAGQSGWSIERRRLQPCPRIVLDGGWEAYLGRLDKKQRHELRRKMRRAEAEGAVVRRVTGPELPAGVETLLELMAHDTEKQDFLTGSMRETFHALAQAAADGGWLRLEFLEVGGEAAAGLMAFDYDDRLWLYNSGLNPAYLPLSPGWVLLGHLIRDAAEGGRRSFDFLRGGEDYKFRLGGEARYVERVIVRRR